MDSSFTIKPSSGVGKSRALRDPVPVREAVETELVASRTVAAAGDGGGKDGHAKDGGSRDDGPKDGGQRGDHVPQDLVADPNSRDVIYRERDVRSLERDHPDQALLRQRAYHRVTPAEPEAPPPSDDPHADIKA